MDSRKKYVEILKYIFSRQINSIKKLIFIIVISILSAFILVQNRENAGTDSSPWKCFKDSLGNSSVCKLECPSGTFALHGMLSCHPWLDCETELILVSVLSFSVVKTVYLAKWKDYYVTLSLLSSKKYEEDFKHNLFMLKSLSGSKFVVQLLGYCDNAIITEYHALGSAFNINYLFTHSLKTYNSILQRLKLCISYSAAVAFLHSSPVGTRVMCDSNTLEKTLSQYLLTLELNIILNDLDATPEIDNATRKGIHCGQRQIEGNFVAPEQIWPYPNEQFDVNKMPLYNEKIDIWKIPDICNWLLGNSSDVDIIKYKLFSVHKLCKSINPSERPNANTVVQMYKQVLNNL